MARYDSNSTEEPGQYPAPAFTQFGLPAQNFGSGAAGSAPPSTVIDAGSTNEPGQYPDRESFTGMRLDDSGAPGTAGIPNEAVSGEPNIGGPEDSVTYSNPTFYKSMYDEGGMQQGYRTQVASDQISGPADWTQANDFGYAAPAQYQMPGVAGNTPVPGGGQHQTDGQNGSAHVMYGGWLKGQRPATSRRTEGGPGT